MVPQTTFVLLSFEGPDPYARAGGIATRVTELAETLVHLGFETHLFFIGDPSLPGYEQRHGGCLHLHRWCQWISRYHPAGVYDGEEGKHRDWNASLPGWLSTNFIAPKIGAGGRVVVLGEEWHTAASIIALRNIVDAAGWQDQVHIVWNANNVFGFERIDWAALQSAAFITTVSRYMRTLMAVRGIDAHVVPNGIGEEWFGPAITLSPRALNHFLSERVVLAKVARWDPDKSWDVTVSAVGVMKRIGLRPLLIARGGAEQYGNAVLAQAAKAELAVRHVRWEGGGILPMVEAIRQGTDADVVVIDNALDRNQCQALFHGVGAVLANSDREPFGLVGLQTMAASGVAVVGCTGEDYATPGHDSFSVQSRSPWELVSVVAKLSDEPGRGVLVRQAARSTAARFTWPAVVRRALFPALEVAGVPSRGLQPDAGRYCSQAPKASKAGHTNILPTIGSPSIPAVPAA